MGMSESDVVMMFKSHRDRPMAAVPSVTVCAEFPSFFFNIRYAHTVTGHRPTKLRAKTALTGRYTYNTPRSQASGKQPNGCALALHTYIRRGRGRRGGRTPRPVHSILVIFTPHGRRHATPAAPPPAQKTRAAAPAAPPPSVLRRSEPPRLLLLRPSPRVPPQKRPTSCLIRICSTLDSS